MSDERNKLEQHCCRGDCVNTTIRNHYLIFNKVALYSNTLAHLYQIPFLSAQEICCRLSNVCADDAADLEALIVADTLIRSEITAERKHTVRTSSGEPSKQAWSWRVLRCF